MLSNQGLPVVDADVLAREAVAPDSPGLTRVRERFGPGVLREDGGLDRGALGRVVFSDPRARADLEAIVHPEVERLSRQAMDRLAADGAKVAIYDVPLLFEKGREHEFDHIVVVHAPDHQRRARLKDRDQLDDAAIDARLAAQDDLDEKAHRARSLGGTVIDNSGSLADTEAQVCSLVAEWRSV